MDLPDLKGKVKIDDSGIAGTEAKLVELAATVRASLAAAGIDEFGKKTSASLDEVAKKLEPTGQAFVTFGKDGEVAIQRITSSTAKTGTELESLKTRATTFAESVKADMTGVTSAVIKLGEDGTASLGRVTDQLQTTQTAATSSTSVWTRLGAAFTAVGGAAIPALIGTIAVLVAALAPLIVEVVAATVIMAAFAVGMGAVAATFFLSIAPLAAVAFGIVKLADATGQVAAPMKTLTDHLKAMADALGKQAAPMAAQLLGFIDSLIPKIQDMGSKIISWFGEHMPQAMSIAAQFADFLFKALDHLGQIIDSFTKKADFNKLWPVMAESISKAIDAGGKLLDNLVRLSDWFLQRLPTMKPIVESIMGGIGTAIQGIGDVAGKVVDWFVQNWPQISSTAQKDVQFITQVFLAIKEGWDRVSPGLQEFQAALVYLQPLFKYIADNANTLRPILIALGVALASLAGTIATVILIAAILVVAVEQIFGAVEAVTTFVVRNFGPALDWVGARMSSLGSTAHAAADDIGAAFSWLGTQVHDILGHIGDVLSGLGSAAHAAAGDFSSAFNGAISTVQSLLDKLGQVGGAVHDALSSIPGVSGATQALHNAHVPGFASGGIALPGSVFRVGERGPETGYALPGGGVAIVPDGGGGGSGGSNITIQIAGVASDPAELARVVRQELSWQMRSL